MNEIDRTMLRAMAWERAKGELNSIKHLYYGNESGFVEFAREVDKFVEHIEDNAIGSFT